MIKQHGIAPLPGQNPESYEKSLAAGSTFYDHVKKLSLYSFLLFVVLAIASFLYTPELLNSPKPGIEVTKPPWPFWVFYPVESIMGITGILLGSALVLVVLLGIPVLAVLIPEQRKLMRTVTIITYFGLIIWAAQMIATYFMPVMEHM